MKKLIFFVGVVFLGTQISGCTPLVVGGAAAGGAYAGYKYKEEGYSINITKEVKGKKANSQTATDNVSKGQQ